MEIRPINLKSLRAHTPPEGSEEWDVLYNHLTNVAMRAKRFAQSFGGGDLAYLLGLWHDLGKVNPEFQDYLVAIWQGARLRKGPAHAIWGGALAYELFRDKECWKELAIPIAAHHGGMEQPGTLEQRLCDFGNSPDWTGRLGIMRSALNQLPRPPAHIRVPPDRLRFEFLIRMLFSCLVDADYLDTERHFDGAKARARGDWTRPADLWYVFRPNQIRMMWNGRGESTVNRVRRRIYRDCVRKASLPPGIFRLTVPTGGGKTRSAIAFALQHALAHPLHGFRRVIVALPYTSIIDQTAREYRDIFGDRLVLEHHSQIELPEGEDQDEHHIRQRLASENWDHPLIVTTTVQLLESLFHNRPARCRKLHSIACSILILDEVQTLPPELLRPTLDVLRVLVEDYGVTIVLSSATQPAFEDTSRLEEFHGVEVHEIVPEHASYFQTLKRVRYQRESTPLDWADVAAHVRMRDHIMVVLNSRKDALELLQELRGTPGLFHLSTLLCGAHRRRALSDIRSRLVKRCLLSKTEPVRLITTQVVEAGVDLDFPEVWRAMGPLERIVQAAGRCNREGQLDEGRVMIFDPAHGRMPRGTYKLGFEKARLLLNDHDPEELHHPELHREYFQQLHNDADDRKARRIQQARSNLDYPCAADEYRLIEDNTVSVIVDYGQGFARLEAWRRAPSRETWQRLQPYLVSIYEHEAHGFLNDSWMEPVEEDSNLYRWVGKYDELCGVQAQLDIADLCGV